MWKTAVKLLAFCPTISYDKTVMKQDTEHRVRIAAVIAGLLILRPCGA